MVGDLEGALVGLAVGLFEGRREVGGKVGTPGMGVGKCDGSFDGGEDGIKVGDGVDPITHSLQARGQKAGYFLQSQEPPAALMSASLLSCTAEHGDSISSVGEKDGEDDG